MLEDALRARVQKTMADFLRIDADLAFTFLRTATIEADRDPRHSESALNKARVALDTLRHLVLRIDEAAVRAEIESRTDELEAAIIAATGA